MTVPDRKRRFLQVPLLGALLGLLALGCEHAPPLEVGDAPTFTDIQATIFNTSCAFSQCHAGSNPPPPPQGLNLSAGQAYANLVGVPSQEQPSLNRIEPGDPDNSYLYLKITGDPSISGQRMPLTGGPLSDAQIQLVRDWILDGAPNN
jgi:hypothetical protein